MESIIWYFFVENNPPTTDDSYYKIDPVPTIEAKSSDVCLKNILTQLNWPDTQYLHGQILINKS